MTKRNPHALTHALLAITTLVTVMATHMPVYPQTAAF
jgi:hypothetical protein